MSTAPLEPAPGEALPEPDLEPSPGEDPGTLPPIETDPDEVPDQAPDDPLPEG